MFTAPAVQIGTIEINGMVRRVWRRETRPTRYIGRCRGCKRRISALLLATVDTGREYYAEGDIAAHPFSNGAILVTCCGRERELLRVRGTYNPRVPCNARCTGAHGHDCECSCNGANHGADHAS